MRVKTLKQTNSLQTTSIKLKTHFDIVCVKVSLVDTVVSAVLLLLAHSSSTLHSITRQNNIKVVLVVAECIAVYVQQVCAQSQHSRCLGSDVWITYREQRRDSY